ncbi:hypothetical protein EDB19DRAFT_1710900 [Suillus lakei]|nr:hypothetical protein EDB19DRAFT_1710900 [Suillus lakei]
MASSYIVRLPDDILLMIFKLVCEEDQVAFDDYLQKEKAVIGRHWDDWGEDLDCDYEEWQFELADHLSAGNIDDSPPRSGLLHATSVCKHWYSLLSQTPSMWTVLQISFHEGAAALEHAWTFLQRSGSCPIQITLLWDDPTWIVPVCWDDVERTKGGLPPTSREEIMAGVHLGLVIQELYAHVHRWREFMLRTTSIAHTYQALSLMSRPSVRPACGLEKLHLQFIHNPRHAVHHVNEPSLFPGSASPIRDLLLFGISCTWPSSSMLSTNLVDLRIHYDAFMNEDGENTSTGPEAEKLAQLLGALVNLRNLALEVDLPHFDAHTIELPHLHSLAIKSNIMVSWAVGFLHDVQMPVLRVLTLCVTTEDPNCIAGLLDELVSLTDSEDSEDPLQLDELHLFNFVHCANTGLLHRLYTQMHTVKILTLGPGADDNTLALAMGLLPTPYGLADLPLSGLRTLVMFDVPKHVVRQIVLERASLAGPLEELYCRYREGDEDEGVPDNWQHQVEKYHRIGSLKSRCYLDLVGRQWSHLV